MSRGERKRILFFAEAVTLAHVVRPLVLAQSLDSDFYEVHFACARRFEFAFGRANFQRWGIDSLSTERFLRALASGSRLYSYKMLEQYVEEDLHVISEVQPDLIIGDFRLSLAISATLAGVTYAALANAYWSPYAIAQSFPLPDIPLTRVLGYSLSGACFRLFQPLIFAYHAQPLNRLRNKYGLPELGSLLDVYTHGDYTLYADPPDFIPTENLPPHHRFLGHVDWSPDMPLPAWWKTLPAETPLIYVNLGSSGPADLLSKIALALSKLPVTVVMATAGRWQPGSLPANVRFCDYLPGDKAARCAAVTICNGGSPSVYQSLLQGVPVLGIPANMDQLLSMQAVERTKTGILLRSALLTEGKMNDALTRLMRDRSYKQKALQIREQLQRVNALERFQSFLAEICPPTGLK